MIKDHQIPKSCLNLFYVIYLRLVCLRISCLFSLSFVWNTSRRGRGWVCFIHCWASMPWHMMTLLCNQKREEYLLKEGMVVSKTISLRCSFSEQTWIWENWLPRAVRTFWGTTEAVIKGEEHCVPGPPRQAGGSRSSCTMLRQLLIHVRPWARAFCSYEFISSLTRCCGGDPWSWPFWVFSFLLSFKSECVFQWMAS